MHDGELPTQNSFIQLSGDGIILTTLKKALNSDDWILQWYESEGKDEDAILIYRAFLNKFLKLTSLKKKKRQFHLKTILLKSGLLNIR
jgi:alpha-mannosidase